MRPPTQQLFQNQLEAEAGTGASEPTEASCLWILLPVPASPASRHPGPLITLVLLRGSPDPRSRCVAVQVSLRWGLENGATRTPRSARGTGSSRRGPWGVSPGDREGVPQTGQRPLPWTS